MLTVNIKNKTLTVYLNILFVPWHEMGGGSCRALLFVRKLPSVLAIWRPGLHQHLHIQIISMVSMSVVDMLKILKAMKPTEAYLVDLNVQEVLVDAQKWFIIGSVHF